MDIKIEYSKDAPSYQTMVDIFHGAWYSAFPDGYQITAGAVRHFDYQVETRVKWASDQLAGGLKGLDVLELGPFEAYNTWQLEDLGAGKVTAIEASNLNFLKCLIVKEITQLKARFLYGDFIPYLEQCHEHFDIVWASGVLYHQTEPLHLLELISRVTDKVFIHTHYYDQAVLAGMPDARAFFIPEKDVRKECRGYQATYHYRSYTKQEPQPHPGRRGLVDRLIHKRAAFDRGIVFAGGPEGYSYWLEKDDIFAFLKASGFTRFQMGVDDPHNPNGSAMFFLAER
jgi:SAM-dependent methyltransferase